MRSTIDIDEKLLQEAQKITGVKTKKELVNLSLGELIKKKRKEHLISLFGSSVLDIGLEDVERLRKNES
jgi:hypothetical protein